MESVRPEKLPDSFDEIDALIPLPVGNDVDPAARENRRQVAAALMKEFGGQVWPYRHVSSPLWKTYDLWGFEGLMTRAATAPDLVAHACRRLTERALAAVADAAALGAGAIWIEECLTDMLAPETFARLHLPQLRRLTEAVRAVGMRSVYYYCGDPKGKWDLLLDAGADALALEEGKKGFTIDIAEVVDRVAGRCTVFGNLDSIGVLQDGTEDLLRGEI